MPKGGDSQHKFSDYVKEETKIRKNLCRLIHTIQHIPSNRDKLDTNSLWNLIGELESFHPESKTKSMQITHKTSKRSFSTQYLNLRLCPSPDRSISPVDRKPNNKFETKAKNCQQRQSYDLSKSKPKRSKKGNERKYQEETTDLSKPHGNKDFTQSKPQNLRNSKPPSSVVQEKENRSRRSFERYPKTETQAKFRRSEKTKLLGKNRSTSKTTIDIHYNDSSDSMKRCDKFIVLDKVKDAKTVNDPKHSFKNNRLGKLSELNKIASAASHSSMVKKLTSYWNNLINGDFEEINSESETSEVPNINKSIQHLARKIYYEAERNQRKTKLGFRDELKPDTRVLKKLQTFSSACKTCNKSSENVQQIYETDTDTEYYDTKSPEQLIPVLENETDSEKKYSNVTVRVESEMDLKPEWDLTTNTAVKVMEKLIFKLNTFPKMSIKSEKITLPQSVKEMLCLMAAAMMSTTSDMVMAKLEHDCVEEVTNFLESPNDPNNLQTPVSSLNEVSPSFNDVCQINIMESNYQLVPMKGLTLRKVEGALRYLALCKDYLWTKFLSDHGTFGSNGDRNPHHVFSTFAFLLFEDAVDFENEPDEEDVFETEEGSHQKDDSSSIWCTSRLTAVKMLDKLMDLTADFIILNCPDSIEDFIQSLYHASISILVWWIIIKEVFLE